MKILLSAYACEPGKGSEPAVGWHWAQEIASLGHEVWVLTRANNRKPIEEALKERPLPNAHFVYFDLPVWLRHLKKGARRVHLYYFLWQMGAFFKAKRLVRENEFDWVHHITFVGIHQPSFMGLLGVPFIYGPVAGGDKAPMALRHSYSLQGKLLDFFRDLWNLKTRWDLMMWLTFASARKIAVTSHQTLELVPGPFRDKCSVHLAVGAEFDETVKARKLEQLHPKLLFVGNLIDLKGVHLALRAFARYLPKSPGSRFTIVGKGPRETRLKQLAQSLGISEAIDWLPFMSQSELKTVYECHDALIFPSLRDSGGMVVLEALSRGLPAVVLDLGGPGAMVDSCCGFRIETGGRDEQAVIEQLAEAMEALFQDAERYAWLSQGALERTSALSWENQVGVFYEALSEAPPDAGSALENKAF